MKTWIGILMISLIALSSCNSSKRTASKRKAKPQGIKFIESKSYDNVLSLAQAQNKPIIVDFYTTWCAPCKWLEQDVFQQRQVSSYYNKNFINYKVNAEDFDGIELAQKFKVQGYPTIIFLNQAGDVLNTHTGNTTASNFMSLGREVVQQNRMYSMVE